MIKINNFIFERRTECFKHFFKNHFKNYFSKVSSNLIHRKKILKYRIFSSLFQYTHLAGF